MRISISSALSSSFITVLRSNACEHSMLICKDRRAISSKSLYSPTYTYSHMVSFPQSFLPYNTLSFNGPLISCDYCHFKTGNNHYRHQKESMKKIGWFMGSTFAFSLLNDKEKREEANDNSSVEQIEEISSSVDSHDILEKAEVGDILSDGPLDYLYPLVIFVLGGPGVGKGTQCARLVADYPMVHFSAGDLLREEQSRPNSPYSKLIQYYLKEGMIVPYQVTISLLKLAMKKHPMNTIFLIDGFPREMDQAWAFEVTVCLSSLVLVFDCEEPILIRRLVGRSSHSGRTDDNMETILKRMITFKAQTKPVIDWYSSIHMVKIVNADGSPDEVYERTKAAVHDIVEYQKCFLSTTHGNIGSSDELVRHPFNRVPLKEKPCHIPASLENIDHRLFRCNS